MSVIMASLVHTATPTFTSVPPIRVTRGSRVTARCRPSTRTSVIALVSSHPLTRTVIPVRATTAGSATDPATTKRTKVLGVDKKWTYGVCQVALCQRVEEDCPCTSHRREDIACSYTIRPSSVGPGKHRALARRRVDAYDRGKSLWARTFAPAARPAPRFRSRSPLLLARQAFFGRLAPPASLQ